jgi:hydroxypyruvate isomerase
MKLNRRNALKNVAGAAALAGSVSVLNPSLLAEPAKLKGNIKHSVSKWCYGKIALDEFCKSVKEMGIQSVELLDEKDWATVKNHGLTCAMCNGPDKIGYGWNRVEHHDKLLEGFTAAIPKVAENGFPNIITFSGERKGMDDETGLKNCAEGLKKLMPIAEKHKVTVILELLNSRVNHKDYMGDHSAWGIELCKRVGSERLKLLYDIYHMQIMEGDIIRNIKDGYQYFGHYHTGGNPGRNDINDSQEIYYPAVMRAILATGYKGYVGQEFIPKSKTDPLAALRESIQICDV